MLTRAALLLTGLLMALSACSGEPDGGTADASDAAAYADACEAVADSTFTSTSQHECGLTPDGAASCFWSISFTGSGTSRQLSWHYSDVSETLSYACSGWTVIAPAGGGGGASHMGTYDPATGILTWEGFEYRKAIR